MSSIVWMFIILIVSIALIIFLIMQEKMDAFVALTIAALVLGILSGMPLEKIGTSFQNGLGSTLSSLAAVIGLGTILGKMLEISGGAQRLANVMIRTFGIRRTQWAMMIVAYLVGIPVFFQVGFIILIPVVFSVALAAKMPLTKVGIPVAAALITVHSLVPPHPAALAIVGTLHAEMGVTIIISLLVAIPAAIIAGPVFGNLISKHVESKPTSDLISKEHLSMEKLPSVGITLWTILLPVLLMIMKTIIDLVAPKSAPYLPFVDFIGHPITALLISAINSYFTLGFARGLKKDDLAKLTNECFKPVAGIILTIGAGGAYNQILQDSGMGKILGQSLTGLSISPIFLAWLIAIIMRFAVGSTTVAMITSAGIMLPVLASYPALNPAIVCVAIGAGGIGFSQVNDSGFWLVKEYFGTSLTDTFKTWTASTIIASVVALAGTFVASLIV